MPSSMKKSYQKLRERISFPSQSSHPQHKKEKRTRSLPFTHKALSSTNEQTDEPEESRAGSPEPAEPTSCITKHEDASRSADLKRVSGTKDAPVEDVSLADGLPGRDATTTRESSDRGPCDQRCEEERPRADSAQPEEAVVVVVGAFEDQVLEDGPLGVAGSSDCAGPVTISTSQSSPADGDFSAFSHDQASYYDELFEAPTSKDTTAPSSTAPETPYTSTNDSDTDEGIHNEDTRITPTPSEDAISIPEDLIQMPRIEALQHIFKEHNAIQQNAAQKQDSSSENASARPLSSEEFEQLSALAGSLQGEVLAALDRLDGSTTVSSSSSTTTTATESHPQPYPQIHRRSASTPTTPTPFLRTPHHRQTALRALRTNAPHFSPSHPGIAAALARREHEVQRMADAAQPFRPLKPEQGRRSVYLVRPRTIEGAGAGPRVVGSGLGAEWMDGAEEAGSRPGTPSRAEGPGVQGQGLRQKSSNMAIRAVGRFKGLGLGERCGKVLNF